MSGFRPGRVHCEIRVCSFTPTFERHGVEMVKWYAIGKKEDVLCACTLAEWVGHVRSGKILANAEVRHGAKDADLD